MLKYLYYIGCSPRPRLLNSLTSPSGTPTVFSESHTPTPPATTSTSSYTDDQDDSQCAQYQTQTDPNWGRLHSELLRRVCNLPQNFDSINQCQD